MITTCLKTVVVGRQRHAPCEILLLQQSPFCVSQISWRLYYCYKDEVKSSRTHFLRYYWIENGVCLS